MIPWHFLVVVLAVVLYCWKSEFAHKVSPVSYKVNLPADFEGPLAVNSKLEDTEKLFEKVLHWPESFAVVSDAIYTGLGDGRIVKIMGDKMVTVTRTGKECAGQHEEHICGRPLGMEFSKKYGLLYVVDAYLGLFSIDVQSGKKTNLIDSAQKVNGLHLGFLNDLAIDHEKGIIYITQSSTKWSIAMFPISVLEHESTGRLLKYDMNTRQVSVILTDMSFPNGVEFSHDMTSLLIAEGHKNKIFKYYLQGKKQGMYTDLPLVLPGEPDNLSRTKRGTYWVGLASARTLKTPALHDFFSEMPWARCGFLHAYRMFSGIFSSVLSAIPHKDAQEFAFRLKSGRILASLSAQHGIIIEFDDSGKIIQSLQSPNGEITSISEVLEHKGYLYLGSWSNPYLGRLKV